MIKLNNICVTLVTNLPVAQTAIHILYIKHLILERL